MCKKSTREYLPRLLELASEDSALRTVKIHTMKDGFRRNNGFDQTADYVVDCFLYALGWLKKVDEQEMQQGISHQDVLDQQLIWPHCSNQNPAM